MNTGMEAKIPGQIPKSDKNSPRALTPTALDYLIRASALQAQVAQSVEQGTENTGNSLTLPP
jgi:hypothetical protein